MHRAGRILKGWWQVQDEANGDPISISRAARWVGPVAVSFIVAFAAGVAGFYWGNDDRSDFEVIANRAEPLVQAAAEGSLVRLEATSDDGVHIVMVRAPGEEEAFLKVDGMPALEKGEAYQSWFSKDGVEFDPGNTFKVSEGDVWIRSFEAIDEYVALAFTIEDEGGAQEPSTAPFLLVELNQTDRAR